MILPKHKKLVVSGCSFASGYGLNDPEQNSWPEILANYFNLECVNLAQDGAGNEYISNAALEHSLNNKDCFYILAYSDYTRMDFGNGNTVAHISANTKKWPKLRDTIYPEFSDNEYLLKKFLLQIIKMQSYFKLNNINYLMVNSIAEIDISAFDRKLTVIADNIDLSTYKISPSDNFNAIIFEDGKQFDGHPNELGHQKIADTLKNWILESSI